MKRSVQNKQAATHFYYCCDVRRTYIGHRLACDFGSALDLRTKNARTNDVDEDGIEWRIPEREESSNQNNVQRSPSSWAHSRLRKTRERHADTMVHDERQAYRDGINDRWPQRRITKSLNERSQHTVQYEQERGRKKKIPGERKINKAPAITTTLVFLFT